MAIRKDMEYVHVDVSLFMGMGVVMETSRPAQRQHSRAAQGFSF
jgi:hypothetical protein